MYVVTFGGGLVAGDVIPVQCTVGEDATLAVASQASTKVGTAHWEGAWWQCSDCILSLWAQAEPYNHPITTP